MAFLRACLAALNPDAVPVLSPAQAADARRRALDSIARALPPA